MNEKFSELAIQTRLISGECNGFDRTDLLPKEEKFAWAIINACIDVIVNEAARISSEIPQPNAANYDPVNVAFQLGKVDASLDCRELLNKYFKKN